MLLRKETIMQHANNLLTMGQERGKRIENNLLTLGRNRIHNTSDVVKIRTNPLRLNCRLRLYGETLSADTVMITTTVMRYTEAPMCLPERSRC